MDALEQLAENVSDPRQLLATYTDYISKLEEYIAGLDERAEMQYRKLRASDDAFVKRLDAQARQLVEIQKALNVVKDKFEKSSDGALRVGLKLEKADGQRKRIQTAIDLMTLVQIFEGIPPSTYDAHDSDDLDEASLRELLPSIWEDYSWGDIARALQGLRNVLHNINSEDAKIAPRNVKKLAGHVEMFLIRKFDASISALIQAPFEDSLRSATLGICSWLHLFNGGNFVQDYYIKSVINQRIIAIGSGIVAVADGDARFNDDDNSSAGDSLPDAVLPPEEKLRRELKASLENISKLPKNLPKKFLTLVPVTATVSAGSFVDSLSELFGLISSICAEQFAIIAKAFPTASIAKVTLLLVRRIFSDSAFGIMTRVEASLRPKPPLARLSLSDYLDCLLTVKEKLFALQIILQEYSSTEVYHKIIASKDTESAASSAREDYMAGAIAAVQDNKLKPESISEEINEFVKDQASKLLEDYLKDYFDKELNFVRLKFIDLITKAASSESVVHKAVGLAATTRPPQLRYEKFKGIEQIVESIGNIKFVTSLLAVVSDVLNRMLVIGQSDARLPARVQQLFFFLLEFISEGLFVPCAHACTTLLLQNAAARPSSTVLPPMEFLSILGTIFVSLGKVKELFNNEFLRVLSAVPNAIPVCTESRKRAGKSIEDAARDALYAWSLAIVAHLEKQLANLQSKYDFCPKSDIGGVNININIGRSAATSGITMACTHTSRSLRQVFDAVKSNASMLDRLNLADLFWRPFGQQFMGVLISHIRKTVVSREGASTLLRDIDEYCNVLNKQDSAELLDMLSCLKEIVAVFVVGPNEVVKIVVEHLRHLDPTIVLSLVKARSDYFPGGSMNRSGAANWIKQLEDIYSIFKSDILLPWEGRKTLTIMAFAESAKNGPGSQKLGPSSLRLVSMISAAKQETFKSTPLAGVGSRNIPFAAANQQGAP